MTTRRLLEEQMAVVVVFDSGTKDDAIGMCHTLAGVTLITPGNSGQGNSVLAVNRVANDLGSSSLCCLHL